MAIWTCAAVIWSTAVVAYGPPTRRRVALRNTALSYADTDVDSSSDRMDALQERAVESLRQDALQELSLIHI